MNTTLQQDIQSHSLRLPSLLPHLDWITDPVRVSRLSQDFSWFSPVLKRQLADKRADIVVRPTCEEDIRQVVSACAKDHIQIGRAHV